MNAAKSEALRPRNRVPKILGIVVGIVIVVIAGAYAAGYFLAGDAAPRNASVRGVPIGGMAKDDAVAKLREELGGKATAPMKVTAGDDSVTISPADAGLGVDYEQTLTAAGAGKSFSPLHIWQVLTGGTDIAPVLSVDGAKLTAASEQAAKELAVEPKNASVSYQDATVVRVKGVQKRTVNPSDVASELRATFLSATDVPVEPTLEDPEITTQEADKVVAEYAKPAVAAPLVIKTDKYGSFEITPTQLAATIAFVPKNGTLEPQVDAKKLYGSVQDHMAKLKMDKPRDARWALSGGKPVVVPATNGVGIKEEDLTKIVVPAIAKSGHERSVTVPVTAQQAKFTTAMAEKAKPTKIIGQFTTNFPHANYRNVNLGQVAKRINGYVLRPGETFSMNDVVGQRTAANGFVDGYVIQGGRLKKESGGGVSQGATTIYNAAFFAGLEDVEHHPHTLYFPRYPAGREATVYYGSLDLRFKNNTQHGVIISSSVNRSSASGPGSITVQIWGTSPYDEIRSPEPQKSNYYSGKTIEDKSPQCEPQSASPGFTATYYRAFIKGGQEVKRDNFKWTYNATDEIKCK